MSVRITAGDEPSWQWPDEDSVTDPAQFDAVVDPDDTDRPSLWRPPRTALRPAWTRGVAGVLAVAALALVVGGLAYRLSVPAPPAAPVASAPPVAPPAPTPSDPVPTATAGSGETSDVTAMPWQGAALPVSAAAGPYRFTETRAQGFSHDQQGAAFAAVHISTHIDPFTGPDVFVPAIEEQVVGGQDLVARTQRAYEVAARRQGLSAEAIAGGAPVLAPTGNITAWRIGTFRPDAVTTVELLVDTPQGQRVVYEVPVVWQDDDWRVSFTTTDSFRVTDPHRPAQFTKFIAMRGGETVE